MSDFLKKIPGSLAATAAPIAQLGDKASKAMKHSTVHLGDKVSKAMKHTGGNGSGLKTTDQSAGARRRRGSRSRKHHKKSAKRHHKKSGKKHHKKSAKRHHKKSGKKHHKKSARRHRARRGGSVVGTAALPFGLLAVQKFFQTRKGRKDLKKMNKSVRRTARRVRRAI